MDRITNLEQARKFFSNDRFAAANGAFIEEIGEKSAKCSLMIDQRHMNAVGGVMGGVSFTLADFAFAVASNRDGAPVVSLSSNITYLSAMKGKKMIADAYCVRDGRTTCYYRVDISDELGTAVAAVTMTGFHIN